MVEHYVFDRKFVDEVLGGSSTSARGGTSRSSSFVLYLDENMLEELDGDTVSPYPVASDATELEQYAVQRTSSTHNDLKAEAPKSANEEN